MFFEPTCLRCRCKKDKWSDLNFTDSQADKFQDALVYAASTVHTSCHDLAWALSSDGVQSHPHIACVLLCSVSVVCHRVGCVHYSRTGMIKDCDTMQIFVWLSSLRESQSMYVSICLLLFWSVFICICSYMHVRLAIKKNRGQYQQNRKRDLMFDDLMFDNF